MLHSPPLRRALAGLVAVLAVAAFAGCGDDEQAINDSLPPEPTFPPSFPLEHEDGVEVSTEAGQECDDIGVHSQMAMWNPTLADEMLETGCPWPWDPAFQDISGGTEDDAIDAPFEPRRYSDAFEVVDAQRFGTCQVAASPADVETGLVFGFDISMHAESCADVLPNVSLKLHEYASRGFRDAAANDTPGAMVLGRWVVQVRGDDTASVQRLTEAMEGLGAVPVD